MRSQQESEGTKNNWVGREACPRHLEAGTRCKSQERGGQGTRGVAQCD